MPDAGVRARLAELRDEVVVGARVVEERDEVPVRRQLQVLIAQFRYQPREVEQLVVVVERRRIECDLHAHASLIEAGSTIWTSTGLPLCSDSTPASQTAAAA